MLHITTESGSHYEIDTMRSIVCRLTGTHEPTPRQGPDHTWRPFLSTSTPTVGEELIFYWNIDHDNNRVEMTMTSPVTTIIEGPDPQIDRPLRD